MNKLLTITLTAAIGAAFAAPVYAQDQDAAGYKSLTVKAAADYKAARAACGSSTGNAKQICLAEAKVERTRADADAASQHNNAPKTLSKARSDVVNAEYDLAKAKCADSTGAERTSCLRDAKTTQTAALADAKAGNTQTLAATVRQDCDQLDGTEKASCLARNTGAATKTVVADSVITTKIKADLVKDPDLKAMDVHVETTKGVVMLSGFVPSQAEATKAEALARGIEGVTDVKSALKVK